MYKEHKFQPMFSEEIRKIPFLRILIPLIFGIVVQERGNVYIYLVLPGIILSFFLVLLFYIITAVRKSGRDKIFGILVFIFLFLAGMGLMRVENITNEPERLRLGRVMNIPEEKDKTCQLILTGLWEKRHAGWYPLKGRILLYVEKSSGVRNVSPGDLIAFYCPLKQIEEPANPMEFDFRRYCSVHGIFRRGFLKTSTWQLLEGNDHFHMKGCSERIRMDLLSLIDDYNFQCQSLVSSLLLGYREQLDEHQKEAFAGSGAMHILAVSGLHVGIIYGMLIFLFKLFSNKRSGLSFLLPVPCIWLYALLTGMTPSVSRAALMLSFYALSRYINRKTNLSNIIFFSAFIMIFFDPKIIYNVSFQLSFMAVTGIAFVFPGLYAHFKTSNRLINQVTGLLCLSVSAQLFTIPLSLYYFHQFPHYFLITNLFVIPLTVLILYAGCMFFLFSFFRPAALFFAHILNFLTGLLQKVTNTISSLPFSETNNIGLDISDVVLLYLFIFFIIACLRYQSGRLLLVGLFMLLIITGKGFCEKVIQNKQKNFMVCSVEGATVLNLIDGFQNIVITSDTSQSCRDRIFYHLNTYWINSGLNEAEFHDFYQSRPDQSGHFYIIRPEKLKNKLVLIQFFKMKIGIVSGQLELNGEIRKKLRLDLLIINAPWTIDLLKLMNYIKPEIIVIDRNVPEWETKKLETTCVKLNIPYHNVYNSGYFMVNDGMME
jgi:competence protein ComEC